jgi:hypothetical protein
LRAQVGDHRRLQRLRQVPEGRNDLSSLERLVEAGTRLRGAGAGEDELLAQIRDLPVREGLALGGVDDVMGRLEVRDRPFGFRGTQAQLRAAVRAPSGDQRFA